MKKLTCLNVASTREVDDSFNSYHEFGHAAFMCFGDFYLTGLRIHKNDGGGTCFGSILNTVSATKREFNGSAFNLERLMIHISGDISNLYFNDLVAPDGSRSDAKYFIERYLLETGAHGPEEMFYFLCEESEKLNVDLTDHQNTLINEYVENYIDYHLVFKGYHVMDITAFHDMMVELVRYMFKLITFVEDDLKGMSMGCANKSYLKRAACDNITKVYTRAFAKVKKNHNLLSVK